MSHRTVTGVPARTANMKGAVAVMSIPSKSRATGGPVHSGVGAGAGAGFGGAADMSFQLSALHANQLDILSWVLIKIH